MQSRSSTRHSGASAKLALALLLVSTSLASAGVGQSIDFGLKCRLPGWPGHPAPTCDPTVADECCPGTKCLPDPFDAEHSTCQQTEGLTVADHALTANVLASRVEDLTSKALTAIKVASTSLYLSDYEQRLSNQAIVQRAQQLTKNVHPFEGEEAGKGFHGDIHKGGKKADLKLRSSNNVDAPAEGHQHKGSTPGGGFDYSKYYNGGGGGASPADGGSQGGFDYQKYMPKNIPSNGDHPHDQKKDGKSSKGKKDNAPTPGEGKGGFDYSQYYPSGGDPHKKGYEGTKKTAEDKAASGGSQGSQGQGGFDYSQYYPQQGQNSKHMEQPTTERTTDDQDDDLVKQAALDLLEADVQLRTSSAQARRDVLERIKGILSKLTDAVDRELGTATTGSEQDWSMRATSTPTVVWNDPNDFWSKYIPKMPSGGYGPGQSGGQQGGNGQGGVQYNSGDRSPGSLGGPCGRTSYKDFGPCRGNLHCVGLEAQKPGLCQMDKATTLLVTREAALHSLSIVDELASSIRIAAMELLVGASPRMDVASTKSGEKGDDSKDLTLTLNETTLDIREYSPTTVAVIGLGFAVIGYFCWMNGPGKRRAYQRLDAV